MFGGVDNFDSREATKGMALLDDGESGSYNSLAPNNGCKCGNNKDGPKNWICRIRLDIKKITNLNLKKKNLEAKLLNLKMN